MEPISNMYWMDKTISMIKEGMKEHPKWPRYLIGNDGRVYSDRHTRLINQHNNGNYLQVWLVNQFSGEKKWERVHRLVAEMFVPNPLNKPEVNHIDGNKLNNHWSNLEWMTHKENIQHSYDVLGRKAPTGEDHWQFGKKASNATKELMSAAKIGVLHPKFKGYYVIPGYGKYPSTYEAEKATGIPKQKVFRWCKGNKHPDWQFEPVDKPKKQ